MTDNGKSIRNYSPGAADGRFLWQKCLNEPYYYPAQREFSELIAAVSGGLRELAGTKDKLLLSTCSGTGALECAIAALHRRSKIVVVRNGYFGDRLFKIACLHFKDVYDFNIPFGKALTEEYTEQLTAFIEDAEADAVLAVHCETSSALMNDIGMIGRICAGKPILTIIDGISALGAAGIELDNDYIDCYIAAAHKALMGMPGLSMIFAGENYLNRADRNWSFYFDLQNLSEKSDRNQYLWSPNLLSLYAVQDSLKKIQSAGKADYYRGLRKKALTFRKKLTVGGLKLIGSSEQQSNCFTALYLPKPSSDKIIAYLHDKFAIVIGKGIGYETDSVLRIGHHPYRTADDLDGLANAVIEAFKAIL